ncbi:MAG: Maf family nucleotide pyrophosphatase [Flavobacteriales bacterium]|nr:Maf family nucleotide pyrophosphatase [Flavobacteriales bacterium]
MIDLGTRKLVLASASPRRQQLLAGLGLPFSVEPRHADEDFPAHLEREAIPIHVAAQKSAAFDNDELADGRIILTSDTIVWVNGHVLNKPEDDEDAKRMLRILSGNMHEVYTAIHLRSNDRIVSDFDRTEVYFRALTEAEIGHYVLNFSPLDKAGAYGIQEWIGYVGIERINGCFFNVMGLPLRKVYAGLQHFSMP